MSTNTFEPELVHDSYCSFCRMSHHKVGPLVEGADSVLICGSCANLVGSIIEQEKQRHRRASAPAVMLDQIHADLLRYFPGQRTAIRSLTTAVSRHCRWGDGTWHPGTVETDTRNILLVGSSDTAQLLAARAVADLFDLPFARTDSASLQSGRDPAHVMSELCHQLLDAANFDMQAAERGIVYIGNIDQRARKQRETSAILPSDWGSLGDDLLKIVDREKALVVEPHRLDTTNILFICGGRFHALPEIVAGRLGISLGSSLAEPEPCLHATRIEDLISIGMPRPLAECFSIVVPLGPIPDEVLVQILASAELRSLFKRKSVSG
jgi:ATP-dependent Clp protease ATP-binding subunit ClpX